jgi:hypothetical protein
MVPDCYVMHMRHQSIHIHSISSQQLVERQDLVLLGTKCAQQNGLAAPAEACNDAFVWLFLMVDSVLIW